MIKAIILIMCALLVDAQYLVQPSLQNANEGVPNPYQFSYSAPSIGGSSSHQESGDGSGRVTGSYSVVDEDGRSRTVEYVADENGFRANVVTNEPGTNNQAPADVTISSSAGDPYEGEQYGAPAGYGGVPLPYAAGPYGAGPLPYGAGPLPYGTGSLPGVLPYGY